jgi:hypothetical protein
MERDEIAKQKAAGRLRRRLESHDYTLQRISDGPLGSRERRHCGFASHDAPE